MEQFEFRCNAQYSEPSRNAMENEISKCKASNNDREPAEKDVGSRRNE